ASAGYGSDASANNGLPYVPTVYTATDQSWAFPYHISLYQYSNTASPVYETSVAQTSDPNNLYAAGDLMEMYDDPTPASAYPVYDISTGKVLTQNNRYIPMVVNPDTATINFDTPALPDPNNPYNRFFYVRISDINAAGGLIDLSQLGNATGQGVTLTSASTQLASPLPAVSFDPNVLPPAPTGTQVANARIVPGSVRVNGPDAYPGPNYGLATPYSEVFAGNSGNPSDNQFEMDYAHNAMRMYVSDLQSIVAVNPNAAISIAFDYQANLAPNDTTNPISAANPASPMLVKVDYQTRDLLDINLGVRVYDPNNVGPAQVVTVHNQVRIGNSNR
ncbi:MAG: hypothetical protein JO250_11645, partial [Armatimonadetes bacterium]|nr:hypothetical protein [Armatimonadota bacterium]